MAKEIRWTKTAIVNFEATLNYLKKSWSQKIIEDFISRTFSLLDLLSRYPELAPLQRKDKNIRGMLITKHNKLFFRIKKRIS
jgi:hypothetical protein